MQWTCASCQTVVSFGKGQSYEVQYHLARCPKTMLTEQRRSDLIAYANAAHVRYMNGS